MNYNITRFYTLLSSAIILLFTNLVDANPDLNGDWKIEYADSNGGMTRGVAHISENSVFGQYFLPSEKQTFHAKLKQVNGAIHTNLYIKQQYVSLTLKPSGTSTLAGKWFMRGTNDRPPFRESVRTYARENSRSFNVSGSETWTKAKTKIQRATLTVTPKWQHKLRGNPLPWMVNRKEAEAAWKTSKMPANWPVIWLDLKGLDLPIQLPKHYWHQQKVLLSIDDPKIILKQIIRYPATQTLRLELRLAPGTKPGIKKLTLNGSSMQFNLRISSGQKTQSPIAIRDVEVLDSQVEQNLIASRHKFNDAIHDIEFLRPDLDMAKKVLEHSRQRLSDEIINQKAWLKERAIAISIKNKAPVVGPDAAGQTKIRKLLSGIEAAEKRIVRIDRTNLYSDEKAKRIKAIQEVIESDKNKIKELKSRRDEDYVLEEIHSARVIKLRKNNLKAAEEKFQNKLAKTQAAEKKRDEALGIIERAQSISTIQVKSIESPDFKVTWESPTPRLTTLKQAISAAESNLKSVEATKKSLFKSYTDALEELNAIEENSVYSAYKSYFAQAGIDSADQLWSNFTSFISGGPRAAGADIVWKSIGNLADPPALHDPAQANMQAYIKKHAEDVKKDSTKGALDNVVKLSTSKKALEHGKNKVLNTLANSDISRKKMEQSVQQLQKMKNEFTSLAGKNGFKAFASQWSKDIIKGLGKDLAKDAIKRTLANWITGDEAAEYVGANLKASAASKVWLEAGKTAWEIKDLLVAYRAQEKQLVAQLNSGQSSTENVSKNQAFVPIQGYQFKVTIHNVNNLGDALSLRLGGVELTRASDGVTFSLSAADASYLLDRQINPILSLYIRPRSR